MGRDLGRTGGVDILVNNAGTTWRSPAHTLPLEKWDEVIATNVRAPFVLAQLFARERIAAAKRGGAILFTASLLSERPGRTTRPTPRRKAPSDSS